MTEQADGKASKRHNTYHKFLKGKKVKDERRKAKLNPQSPPTYGKYQGYET